MIIAAFFVYFLACDFVCVLELQAVSTVVSWWPWLIPLVVLELGVLTLAFVRVAERRGWL